MFESVERRSRSADHRYAVWAQAPNPPRRWTLAASGRRFWWTMLVNRTPKTNDPDWQSRALLPQEVEP